MNTSSNNRVTSESQSRLSRKHQACLFEESGIAPDVAAERGYRTATRRDQLRRLFPVWQRRAPALWVPIFSPDGETSSAQIRPDNPRRDGKGKIRKYENATGAKCTLDVHPRNRAALADTSVPVWIVEGIKKGDALTSRGAVAVSIVGVWNWLREGKPLPCWDYIALQGREVYVAFDSDVLLKPEVQLALERLAAFLAARGASVNVTYLPGGQGDDKLGVDDFLAAGGTVEELRTRSRAYAPSDLTRLRLKRSPGLRERLEELRGLAENMPTHKQSDFTRLSVFRAALKLAERYGTVCKDGVRVVAATRTLAELARISERRVRAHLDTLEETGWLRRDYEGRQREQAGKIVLFTPRANTGRQDTTPSAKTPHQDHKSCKRAGFESGAISANAPHMEGGEAEAQRFVGVTLPSAAQMRSVEDVPEMRWSTVLRSTEKDKRTGERFYVYDYLRRVGKKSARIVEHLVATGKTATVSELAEEFGTEAERKRPWDFRRRHIIPLLDPAVVVLVGNDIVDLAADWLEGLENARKQGQEPEAEERQKSDHALQRRRFAYHLADTTKPDPEPEMPAMDDMSEPWPYHPEGCACRECSDRHGPVLGRDHVEDCRCRVCFARKRGRPVPAGAVGLVEARPRSAPVRSAPARSAPVEEPPDAPVDPALDHPLGCECFDCGAPMPRYVRAYSGREWGGA